MKFDSFFTQSPAGEIELNLRCFIAGNNMPNRTLKLTFKDFDKVVPSLSLEGGYIQLHQTPITKVIEIFRDLNSKADQPIMPSDRVDYPTPDPNNDMDCG